MMDNDDSLALPEIEDHETKKYKKHVNDLIDDAELEAEIEAEKKIRSKNSRIFLISMVGLGLLSFVYLQINSPKDVEKLNVPIQIPTNTAELILAKQAPIVDNGKSHILLPPTNKPKSFVKQTKITPEKKLDSILKPNITSKPNSKNKGTSNKTKLKDKNKASKSLKTNNTFFVQTGAFSLKENANTLVKKLQAKGFNPSMHVVANGPKKTYRVQLGVFPNKEKAKLIQEKLARAGYPKTIIK